MRILLVTSALIFFLFTENVISDTYIVQSTHTDGYSVAGMSVPAQDEQSIIWSSGDKIRINSNSDTSMIMRMDKSKLYIIYKETQEYTEINLDDLQKSMDIAKSSVENAAAASGIPESMAAMMKFEASVNPTKESKKIGKWNCTKYKISTTMPMGTVTTELWASTDVKIDYLNLAKMKNFAMSQMPGFANMMKEFEKVKGFPVVTETSTSVMGVTIKTKEELMEASEKDAPAGIYDIPVKYKKVEFE